MLIHVNRQGRNNLEYEKVQLLNLVVQEKETKNGKATSRLQERQIGRNCTKKRSKTSIHEYGGFDRYFDNLLLKYATRSQV
jgi:hypothetical protein